MYDAMRLSMRIIASVAIPAAFLYALYLALSTVNGDGVLHGALAVALAVCAYALVFGPAAAAKALPPRRLFRLAALAALFLLGAAVAETAGAPPLAHEAAAGFAFVIAAATMPLALIALLGRAHAMRDKDW